MGAEFVAERGLLKGLILSLEEGEEWLIGRDPAQVTIVIEDAEVDRLQLRCVRSNEGYALENLSFKSKALINDEPLEELTLLHGGDLVTIGQTEFRFYSEGRSEELSEEAYTFEVDAPDEDLFEETPPPPSEPESPLLEPEAPPLEDELHEPIYEPESEPEINIDLTPTTRFLIKVIAGPNTGAEFALDEGRDYIIGTDTLSCDIVFNDLSVSSEHAQLRVTSDGEVVIEDKESRNGVVVNQSRITGPTRLPPNVVISFGTSAVLLIDREAPSETLAAPLFDAPQPQEEESAPEKREGAAPSLAAAQITKPASFSMGALLLALIICGVAVLFGIGMVSLLQTSDVERVKVDYDAQIAQIVRDYPKVEYTYNSTSGKLFLMGHVLTGVDLNELMYKLKGLSFIRGIENNIVNDEAVWQEVNLLLSKHPAFRGVSLHAPRPAHFILSGYLKTEAQAVDLMDYMNVNFNYLSLLQNRVVVEEQVAEEVGSQLRQRGLDAVNVTFLSGELLFTGYISSTQIYDFDTMVKKVAKIPGVRSVKNFVVVVSPEKSVIDLSERYPGRYRVTGFSKHGNVNINVVINGKILTRGDQIDGLTITSIQPHTIFFERDGLKYKIEYNK